MSAPAVPSAPRASAWGPQVAGSREHAYAPSATTVAQVGELREAAERSGRTLTLLGIALANAGEVHEVCGSAGLESLTATVAHRAVASEPACRLLRITPTGGLLLALTAAADEAETLVARVESAMTGFVALPGVGSTWPAVTGGARTVCADDDVRVALRDVRATVADAVRRTPGTVRWFRPRVHGTPQRGLRLVADLAAALERPDAELHLAYQPIRRLSGGGRIVAAEALLRWDHPERGPVSPLDTIAAAESSGLIHRLGGWILDRAAQQAARWQRAGHDLVVHVNVSAMELRSPGYADMVAETLGRHCLAAESLLLELTETGLMSGDVDVLDSLQQLRLLGVGLGIDDFGTGWSSIAQLLTLPVDTVKVDRSLIAGLHTTAQDFDLVRAVLGLLETAPLTVIMEGIEHPAQVAHLRALGCTQGQGYLLGRPASAAQVTAWLDDRPARALRAVPGHALTPGDHGTVVA